MFKKIAALITIPFVLFGTAVYAQEESAAPESQEYRMILLDEFNSYNAGMPFGWSVDASVISPATVKGRKCARLTSTEQRADAGMQKIFGSPLRGRIVMEAKIYPNNVNTTRLLFAVKDSSGLEFQTLKFNSNGNITVLPGDKKLMMYRPETWYHLQILLDTNTKTMDVYVDGKQLLDGHPIAVPDLADVQQINLKQWDRNNANVCLDDIYVYQNETVLTSEQLQEKVNVVYSDIADCWAKEPITFFADLKLLERTADGKFYPDELLTNRQMAEFVNSIMPFATRSYANTFPDVKASDSYALGLQAQIDWGVMSTRKYFKPDDPVTLRQAVTQLVEIYKYAKKALPDADRWKTADLQTRGKYARDLFAQAEALHLFDGVKDITYGNLDENATITRAQYIAMFKNLHVQVN